MNADHFKQELLALEKKLKDESPPHHQAAMQNARQLYFELQRLVHQYASIQVKVESTKLS